MDSALVRTTDGSQGDSSGDLGERAALKALNVASFGALMRADAGWYDQHLAEEFVCRGADGSRLDRAAFLHRASQGPDVREFQLRKVRIQIEGDDASIESSGAFTGADGSSGTFRYTNWYQRRAGEWKIVSAHVKRSRGPTS